MNIWGYIYGTLSQATSVGMQVTCLSMLKPLSRGRQMNYYQLQLNYFICPMSCLWKTLLYTSRFLLTGYVGLILCNTAKVTTSWSTVDGTVEGTLQLLHAGYSCHSCCSVPSKYPQRYSNLQQPQRTASYENYVASHINHINFISIRTIHQKSEQQKSYGGVGWKANQACKIAYPLRNRETIYLHYKNIHNQIRHKSYVGYNDQQDKTGTGSKESKTKYDYSYV